MYHQAASAASGGGEDYSDDDGDEAASLQPPPPGCSVRLCQSLAAGQGPHSKLPLCQRHLAADVAKVQQLRSRVAASAAAAVAAAEAARPKQLRLAAELQHLEASFDALHRTLDVWQARLTGRVKRQHDSLLLSLQVGSECRQFQRDLATAEGLGDLTQVFKLASAIEPLLPTPEEAAAEPLANPATVAVDIDVSGRVQNLLVTIDTELGQLDQSLTAAEPPAQAPPAQATYARYAGTLDRFDGAPTWLAVCDNTAGYAAVTAATAAGGSCARLMKLTATTPAAAAEAGVKASRRVTSKQQQQPPPLPQRLLFVAYNPDERKDHLAVVSVDGRLRLKAFSDGGGGGSIDWGAGVWGLHCDSARQLLYLGQGSAGVCVTDLACAVLHRVTAAGLDCQTINLRVSGLAGNADKLFAYNHRQRTVLVIGKEDLRLHSAASLGPGSDTFDGALATVASGRLVLATDWRAGCLQRLCPASGWRLPPLPVAGGLAAPHAVAVDGRRAVVFVSDFERRSVRALLACGRDCQTAQLLQPPTPFVAPCGLAVAAANVDGEAAVSAIDSAADNEAANAAWLFVADSGRNCVVVFSLL